jgi:Tetratricopeptide repeat
MSISRKIEQTLFPRYWDEPVYQGKYNEAASLFQRALAIREQWLEPAHPDILATSTAYAAARSALDQH